MWIVGNGRMTMVNTEKLSSISIMPFLDQFDLVAFQKSEDDGEILCKYNSLEEAGAEMERIQNSLREEKKVHWCE